MHAFPRAAMVNCTRKHSRHLLRAGRLPLSHCPSAALPHHASLMTLEEITARICAFRDARDWMQFHNPKELAVAITAEAGELLQHFVWQQPGQVEQRAKDKLPEITDEMADVGILLCELAHNLGVDLGQAMLDKVERNETRYPVAKAKGSNAKYNEL